MSLSIRIRTLQGRVFQLFCVYSVIQSLLVLVSLTNNDQNRIQKSYRYYNSNSKTNSMFFVSAVIPQLAIDITWQDPSTSTSTSTRTRTKTQTLYASHAFFGTIPSYRSYDDDTITDTTYQIVFPPDDNPLLCNDIIANTNQSLLTTDGNTNNNRSIFPSNSIVFVPRGQCSFQTKARIAQNLQASALIIYGTLASRYSLQTQALNSTSTSTTNTTSIVWPLDKYDYDCTNGRAVIPSSYLSFDPLPYDAKHNDPQLMGSTSDNACYHYSPDQLQSCPSKQCLLTGKQFLNNNNNTTSTTSYEACCAWDLHIWLYADNRRPSTSTSNITSTTSTTSTDTISDDSTNLTTVTIPVGYITTEQMNDIRTILFESTNSIKQPTFVFYARWRPKYNLSAILIWILGSAVAALASYLTATDYRKLIRSYTKKKKQQQQQQQQRNTFSRTPSSNSDTEYNTGLPNSTNEKDTILRPPTSDNLTNTTTDPSSSVTQHQQQQQQEVLELTPLHALGFVIMASSSLMILFYFKIYGIVKIFYAIGCSTAVSQVIIVPTIDNVLKLLSIRNVTVCRCDTEDIGDITIRDVVAFTIGYILGFVWLFMALTYNDAETHLFFWLAQDIFGACMCITFLQVIRLNSIRVASLLLIVAFVYDIFFVFITPLIFGGKSVMITVATSGGPPKQDALWCEKYPNDADCQGGNPMPMLFAIPKVNDFVGGTSLLGLGDIVLPGLLLSFAARYDAAKAFIGIRGGGRGTPRSAYSTCPEQRLLVCCSGSTLICNNGYFPPICIAYAIGLLMANTAVYVMNMGQPALLYLVPTCLGTLVFMGYRRNELVDLWDGPKVLKIADDILYGTVTTNTTSSNNNNGVDYSSIPLQEHEHEHEQQQLSTTIPLTLDDGDTDDEINSPATATTN